MKPPRLPRTRKRSKPAAGASASRPPRQGPGQGRTTGDRPESAPAQQRQIQDLIDLLKRNSLTELEWECETYRVRLRHDAEVKPAGSAGPESALPPPAAEPVAGKEMVDGSGLMTITSPIVGTFYRSPAPDADPYVEEGDTVKKGQVLCIVEAMKLMNEIESEVDGRIVKILVESAKPVEYGQPLFLIEPSSGS